MKNLHRSPKFLLKCLLLALAVAMGSGCFFGDDGAANGGGGSWDDFPNPSANQCGDITPDQMKKADALMAVANPKLSQETEFFLGDSAADWDAAKQRKLPDLRNQYATAVKAAPNHCGAIFAHGVTTATSVIANAKLDSLVESAGKTGGDFGGMEGLAKVGADGGAGALFKLRRGLQGVDKGTFTLAREVIETVLLPSLDTAITALEKVGKNPDFEFYLVVDGDSVRIDRSEVSPILGGLKVLKAALYIVVGYEWQPEADEELPFARALSEMDGEDFDSLTLEQRNALDHYTGLFKSGSMFSRIRAGYEAKVASIPDLLLQAVGHVQDGLAHGIALSKRPGSQKYKPYLIGTGEDADVDPADLQRGIDMLELTRKYLRGVVPIAYNNGRDTLKVDFPKLFRINGLQGLLPHFRFLPYEKWNDTIQVRFDTVLTWDDSIRIDTLVEIRGPIQFTDAAGDSTLETPELFTGIDSLPELTGKITFPDPTFGGVFPGLTNANFWIVLDKLSQESPDNKKDCDAMTGDCKITLRPNPSDLDRLEEFFGNLPDGAAGFGGDGGGVIVPLDSSGRTPQ